MKPSICVRTLVNIFVYINLIQMVRGAGILYQSPCPGVFEYAVDGDNELIGFIEVPYPNTDSVHLFIELSVGNRVQGGFNGHVELSNNKQKVVEDAMKRGIVRYKLRFPYWESTPPRVTKISVNSRDVCSGSPIDLQTVPVVSVVKLQHTLTLRLASQEDSSRFPIFSMPTTTDGYDLRKINFNPVQPKDPSRIYNSNVFLNSLATAAPSVYEDSGLKNEFGDERIPYMFYSKNPFLGAVTAAPQKVPVSSDSEQPYGRVCGRLGGSQLVANGDHVQPGSFPWLVAIYTNKNTGLEFSCGGTLISNKHVLSAAHCFRTETKNLHPEDIVLTLGRHNIMDWDRNMISGASSIVVHQDYVYTTNNMTADADLALVTMRKPVNRFTKLVRPICLWTEPVDLEGIVGQPGLVAGWGRDESGSLTTKEPKRVMLPVVSQEECRSSHALFRDITSDRTFCAGSRNGIGPCNGDSGGGFVLKRNGLWTLRGVVSMSIVDHETACDLYNYFVFTDTAKFNDWLLPFLYD